MTPDAYTADDQPIDASQFSSAEWEALKTASADQSFVFTMGCCGARALLKTSPHGVQFFAHESDACATAPETQWHVAAKDRVLDALKHLGIQACRAVSGGTGQSTWQADVYFEIGYRKAAIELQRAYQPLQEFMARQECYRRSGVECYWLVPQEVATPLHKAILEQRRATAWDQFMPPELIYVNVPEFFVATFYPDQEQSIRAPRLVVDHCELLEAIVNNRLSYDGQLWRMAR